MTAPARALFSPPPGASQTAAWALLPLRAFLGLTFCYAGLQKLANPAFLQSANPASIQSQLAAAARRSPIHVFLGPLVHVAVPLGLLIALGEIAVGLGTLLGLYARAAAVGGALISLMLFLAVSFHTNPYYTGSDIGFVFAWLPFVVAGAGSLSADALIVEAAARARSRTGNRRAVDPGRRELVTRAGAATVVAGGAVVLAGLTAAVGRLFSGGRPAAASALAAGGAADPTTTTSGPEATSAPTSAGPSGADPSRSTTSTTAASHPPGVRLGPASRVPVGGAATFSDPRTGDPGIVLQPDAGNFLAFDAVCPHAGCTVEYDGSQRLFVCPCHGSQFNGRTGDVEVGPAQSGLSKISVAEGSDGQLYAQ